MSTDFGGDVSIGVCIRKEDVAAFAKDITELSAGRLAPVLFSEGWNEM